ncbi:MAG TPA: antitoxin Xre/MbcA/ParS toxin-binding domain-containing protein [Gemmatimonadales bacterium]|jgi:hypothetical protein
MTTESPRAKAELRQVRRAVEWATDELELTDEEVGGALGASARSVVRWRVARNRPSSRYVAAATQLLELAHALQAVFGNDLEQTQAWLHEPLPAFRGRTALRMVVDGRINEVVTALANADSGAFR